MLRSCLMTTMINAKCLLEMFYSSIETEYTEVMSYINHDQSQVLGQNVLLKHQNWLYWGHVLWQPWSIPSTCSKCSIQVSKLNILRSCFITTMINFKYLLKMLYSSIETEYTEVNSYNNQDQSQVFAQNVIFKHRNWIYWGHVLWQPWSIPSTCSKFSIQASKMNILRSCLITTMINAKYLVKMFYSRIKTQYTEVMSYDNDEQSQVLGQNVLFKHQNLIYWGHVLWQRWSIPSTCLKCSIQASKLNILRSCLITIMMNPKYLLKMLYSSIETEYTEVMSDDNHDQCQVLAQNVLFKHRNWISCGHVL